MKLRSIGILHTPFKTKENMPIQPAGARGIKGRAEIKPKYAKGLDDLDGFSHIYLIYYFHKSGKYSLSVKPFLDDTYRGLFSTRAPKRPNRIGISVVKLLSVKDNILELENVDMLDGTPLLDIKPYVPEFDHFRVEKIGWLEKNSGKTHTTKSDGRFDF